MASKPQMGGPSGAPLTEAQRKERIKLLSGAEETAAETGSSGVGGRRLSASASASNVTLARRMLEGDFGDAAAGRGTGGDGSSGTTGGDTGLSQRVLQANAARRAAGRLGAMSTGGAEGTAALPVSGRRAAETGDRATGRESTRDRLRPGEVRRRRGARQTLGAA